MRISNECMQTTNTKILTHLDNICTISSGGEMKAKPFFLGKFEILVCNSWVDVDFVSNNNDWDIRSLLAHFFVPVSEVLVRLLAGHIKNKYASMCAIVIRRVHACKPLLSSCVPEIYKEQPRTVNGV